MHKKRKILIIFLTVILIIAGSFGVLVWGLNTVSQNEKLTTKFIHFQIKRLLDLESEVVNPRAYLDWDLQYKIRADKLSFIHENSDIISVEDIQLNVFVPRLLFKKIHITQMSGSNLYADFERYENGKINIIEIFNITGFFKVYFQNSSISFDKYFFEFTDNFYKPAEKLYLSGDNIFISKFTLNRYLQLIVDGNIDYKKRLTNFAVSYNAKLPTAKNDFNLEIRVPDFDASIFKTYVEEFAPNTILRGKGNISAKISNNKYVNIQTNLEDIELKNPKLPVSFDFKDKFALSTKFAYENKDFTIENLRVKGKDFDTTIHGKVFDISSLPLNIDLYVKVAENSNGNSLMKLLPWGLPAMNYAVDKAKKHNVGAIVSGDVHAKGRIGYLDIYGQVKAKNANLGYGFDYPSSTATLDFKGEKMYIDAIYYPNRNQNQFAQVTGNIKIKKPVYLDLKTNTSSSIDVVSGQKALNIFSNIFNFSTGPLALMEIKSGFVTLPYLEIQATPPFVYLNGKAKFWDAAGSLPGLYGGVTNASGEVDFAGKDIVFHSIKAKQEDVWGYAHGKTELHKNGLTHFYLDLPKVPLDLAKVYVDNSPLIKDISNALRVIIDPVGTAQISFVLVSEKDSPQPYTEGFVSVNKGASCNIQDLAYRATDVEGRVDFTSKQSNINFDGFVHGVKTKLTGTAEAKYSNLLIENPAADINAAYEFFVNSPMFADMKDSLKDFSEFNGTMDIKTKIYGDLSKDEPNFITNIDIQKGSLKYLDIPEVIEVNSGHFSATKSQLKLNQIRGLVYNTPFNLNGIISDAGTKNEKYDLKFEMYNFPVSNVSGLLPTQLFKADESELLSKFSYKNGYVDVISYIDKEENKSKILFNNANICYIESNKPVYVKSGDLFVSKDVLRFNDLDVQMTNSKILIDGNIQNYKTQNPSVNIDLLAEISADDFNETVVPLFNLPVTLSGKIYSSINAVGSLDNWHTKMRAMLEDNAYVTYKNAQIGAGLSKFMFFDIKGNKNNVDINTLDIFSPTVDPQTNNPEILAQMYGSIKNINTNKPTLNDFHIKLSDYMNISFLNILFYDENKTEPLFADGKIKGNIEVNGDIDNASILGTAEILDASVPSIATTVEKMIINFNEKLISTKDTIINIAGSKANITAIMENDLSTPFSVKEIKITSDFLDIDNILKTFNNLFANKTSVSEKAINVDVETTSPPILIEKGKIDLKEIIRNGLPIKNLVADIKITPDWNCEIKNIAANISNGSIFGEALYNFATTDFAGNIEIDNVTADAIATAFMNLPNELRGEMDANAKFTTKGKTQEERINNMTGTAYFKLLNGRMLRLGSLEYMLRVANTFQSGITRLNLNAIVNLVAPKTGYFDTIEGDFKIQNGVISTDKITSRSSELNLFLSGMYNMNDSVVNATVIGQMPKESKESILWLGSLGRISLNSLVKQLMRDASKDNVDDFFYNPESYLDTISGLKSSSPDHSFFVISLKGNLYNDKYLDDFKWIK